MDGDGSMWSHGWGWGAWPALCVVMVLFWAGLLVAVAAAIRYLAADRSEIGPRRPQGESILAERFARGEIGNDEYRPRLATLREHHETV